MQAEIITIGNEILIGQIVDSNSKWIAKELDKIGISVYQITSIQDDRQHILKAIYQAEKKSDIIIITGGLGPTKDDITKYTLVEYFKDKLVLYNDIQEHIKMLFTKIKYAYTEMDLLQAMLPKKAIIFKNFSGTASGMWFTKKNKVVVSLPGVPNEMKALLKHNVLPKIIKEFKLPYIIHKTIITYGIGESKIAKILENWENNLPKNIKLAYLPSYGKTRLRLTAKGKNKTYLEQLIQISLNELTTLLKDITFGEENTKPIEELIGEQLIRKKQTIATAESCTGGNIAKIITQVAGSSKYFIGSVVSYNVRIKIEFLKVRQQTIDKHSVVSKQVAKEMAENIKKIYKTDFAIATTGNAGPTKDKTDKTIGDVYIAIATPKKTIIKQYNFGWPREKVIEKASIKALELVQKMI
ncbi:MAG: competence/damage-inducible protein A [Flavobacteriaceae bacterium]|nr:competence/damage-inducible protein A [Flavobacteriaceae bacterium]